MGKIAAFRKDVLKLSQEEFARRIGLTSKSRVSEIEKADTCPPHIALEIEKLSGGAIDAGSISETVAAARSAA